METISINKLRSALKEVLERVADGEETILVTLRGKPLAQITPPSAAALAALERQEEQPRSPRRVPELADEQLLPPPSPPPVSEPILATVLPPEGEEEAPAPASRPVAKVRAAKVQAPAAPEDDEDDDEGTTASGRPRRRRRRRSRTESAPEPVTSEMSASETSASKTPAAPPPRERPPAAAQAQADDDYGDVEEDFERSIRSERQDDSYRAIPQHPVAITSESFASFGLSETILRCIREIGFEHPTPIQAAVIPPALEGRDVIGLAQTGSGKTAAFCLPMAERFSHGRGVRGLILSPTREIAMQTKAFLDLFGKDRQLDTVCLIGGVPMGPQITGLKRNPDILVATPGRLLDHVRRRNVRLDAIEELVLDEADHMLDLGFMPQIADILEYVPSKRRTMMFSATMPPDIERLAQRLMDDPVRIDILPEGAAEGITHRLYLVTDEEDKKMAALALLNQELGSTLVFIRRKVDAEWLTKVLEKEGHPVERIHSDLSQKHRVRALSSFREGQHRILVATDIAARGLDVPRIQHVINFDLPAQAEDYIHRAGRTARGKLRGTVSSICTWKDKLMIRELESVLGEEIPRCTVPGVEPYIERNRGRSGRGRHKLPTRRRL
jgi:prevent-host-death family protein